MCSAQTASIYKHTYSCTCMGTNTSSHEHKHTCLYMHTNTINSADKKNPLKISCAHANTDMCLICTQTYSHIYSCTQVNVHTQRLAQIVLFVYS